MMHLKSFFMYILWVVMIVEKELSTMFLPNMILILLSALAYIIINHSIHSG